MEQNSKQNKERKEYEYRPLSELNLMDNFLFGAALDDPETGEELAARILKIITGKVFNNLKVVIQRQICGTDTHLHGARLDLYIEDAPEGELATVYDVEPEKKDSKKVIKSLPRRTRLYHAKLGSVCLESGQAYENLKNVMVIMIMPFDPFGMDRMVYTIKNQCVEEPDMPYDDGATTIFLYTKGRKGIPSQELKEFLNYFENTTDENAVNPDLKSINGIVSKIKHKAEVGVRYMQVMEDEKYLINQGISQGINQGIEMGALDYSFRIVKRGKSTLSEEASIFGMSTDEYADKMRAAGYTVTEQQ